MMKQIQHFFSFSLLLLFLLHCTTTLAQGPAQAPALPAQAPALPAQAPTVPVLGPTSPAQVAAPPSLATPPPTNVTKILEKSGGFNVLIRLLKSTAVDFQLYKALNNSNTGATIFAPTDSAFSKLKGGTLNSLTDDQKVKLIQYHILPQYITLSNFQTVTNPLRTNAGGTADGWFPLNVTNNGNSVNISTGLTNASVSGTVYTDGQVAIYSVDKVLKPQGVFNPRPPAPAPAPAPPKKKPHAAAPETGIVPVDTSSAVSLSMRNVVPIGIAIVAALWL